MQRFVAATILTALVLGQPLQSRAEPVAHTQAEEAGLALGAAGLNLFYLPFKGMLAIGGLFLGAAAGFLNGGDTRSAYALWVPAAGGTYLLTVEHLEGSKDIELFGSDYADTPSSFGNGGGTIYEAAYSSH
jgi:hypothetical protein